MSISWSELSGTIFVNPELSKQARFISSKMMRMFELVTPADDFFLGKKSGDTIGFKLWGRIAGTSETALSEFQKVPMTTLPQYTAQATVSRRGIAVPFTKYREDLDRLTVEDPIVHGLQEQSARTHNKIIYNALVSGRSFIYTPLTATTQDFQTNGTPAQSAAAKFSGYHARQIALYLKKYNTPKADGNYYHSVVSPTMMMNLFDDTAAVTGFVDVKRYTSSADGLLEGEVGMYHGIRFMEDNDVLPDAIGTGTAYGSGFVVGYDACREVPVYNMELLANMNLGGDFGQQKALAWLSLLTYKTVWVYASHGQGTVLHYTST